MSFTDQAQARKKEIQKMAEPVARWNIQLDGYAQRILDNRPESLMSESDKKMILTELDNFEASVKRMLKHV